jgi:glycosyltransferase involved in cell wall biosynthesis
MKISVAMTTYNGELYLRQQLDSILAQTLKPAEIVICDDGSSDGTISILKEYQQHGDIKLLVNEERLGVIRNFKKAVSITAPSNYVALSDQDDIWLPEKLSTLAALLIKMDQNHPALVHSDLVLIDSNNEVLNPSFKNEQGQGGYEENLQTLFFRNFVTGCTVLMNPKLKQMFQDIPNGISFHDEWLALLAFTFGNVDVVNAPTVLYRKHDSNVSIAPNTKPRNRYKAVVQQIIKSFLNKDDFIAEQFVTVKTFYNQYMNQIDLLKRSYFEEFLKLENKSYLIKKIAFRQVVNKFRK